jgi:hypothetical protein
VVLDREETLDEMWDPPAPGLGELQHSSTQVIWVQTAP